MQPENVAQIQEVVLSGTSKKKYKNKKENPAYAIMQEVWKRKKTNGLANYDDYQFKEYEKIDTYIHTLLQSSDLTESARVCDHHMLNVILSRYQRQCQEKYITFHTDIRSGVLRHLPDADLTAIFCNILDNALKNILH